MVIAYFSSGLACLSKGPVGLVLPGMLLLIWCGLMRNKKLFLRLFPWQGILIFFITALPWYACMYAIHGDPFIREFLGLHNIVRATSSEHPGDNHFYYYFLLLPFSLLPWTGLFFYEIKKQWKEKTSFYLFLMVWCFGTLLFYTLMATKYVTYTYIALVPAAVSCRPCRTGCDKRKENPGTACDNSVPPFACCAARRYILFPGFPMVAALHCNRLFCMGPSLPLA